MGAAYFGAVNAKWFYQLLYWISLGTVWLSSLDMGQ